MKQDINNMREEELRKFVYKSRENIYELLKEYEAMIDENLKKNESIETTRRKAYDIIKIYNYVHWVNEQIKMNNNASRDTKVIPRRGEIWTCELGQNIGSEENKIRPVIIIQNDTGNQNAPTTIVVPISNRPKKIAVHISIRNGDFELVKGEKMEITGTVLAEQIRIVSKARLGRHVATLSDKFMQLLDSKIKISLDL